MPGAPLEIHSLNHLNPTAKTVDNSESPQVFLFG